MTLPNWCGYQRNGIRLAVVFPYKGGFALAGRTYGGYLVEYASVAEAQAVAALLNPYLSYWQEEQVEQ